MLIRKGKPSAETLIDVLFRSLMRKHLPIFNIIRCTAVERFKANRKLSGLQSVLNKRQNAMQQNISIKLIVSYIRLANTIFGAKKQNTFFLANFMGLNPKMSLGFHG